MAEAEVRAAFTTQAGHCRELGSPFTALLCETLGRGLDLGTAIGRRVLGWEGVPDALHDSVPLRLVGGLHALVRRGRLPELARLYPPGTCPDEDALWSVLAPGLAEAATELDRWLDGPPQTNEVGRSAVLMAGLAVIAAERGLPVALYELGASAGLNLLLDRYRCRLGTRAHGDPASAVVLQPDWTGADPPEAEPRVVRRGGVDISPLNVADPSDRERLLAYVWPDQPERLARLAAALAIASAEPPPLERGDAAEWLGARLPRGPEPGLVRVVLHSIAFQYFPATTQHRIAEIVEAAGAGATSAGPLAWLRYEADPAEGGQPTLRLCSWPGGSDRRLAVAHPHGAWIRWSG